MFNNVQKGKKIAQFEIWGRNLGEILRDMFRKGRPVILGLKIKKGQDS